MAFPEAFRELVAQGAKLVIVPTFWTLADCSEKGLRRNPFAEQLFLESVLVARAFENTCAVVFVNAGGVKEGDGEGESGRGSWAGGSQVAVPFEGARGKLGWCEGMGVVDVDMEICEFAFRSVLGFYLPSLSFKLPLNYYLFFLRTKSRFVDIDREGIRRPVFQMC